MYLCKMQGLKLNLKLDFQSALIYHYHERSVISSGKCTIFYDFDYRFWNTLNVENPNTLKASGLDQIGPILLKLSADAFSGSLTNVNNCNIKQCVVQEQLKCANVNPIYTFFYSCKTLVSMIDNWLTALNNDEFVGVVILDFSKAFDLCSHEILSKKLKNI